jgi:hypothetical protein
VKVTYVYFSVATSASTGSFDLEEDHGACGSDPQRKL